MKTREAPLVLGNEYELHWADYSRLGPGPGETLRMLVVPVARPAVRAAVAPTPVAAGEPTVPVAGLVAEAKRVRGAGAHVVRPTVQRGRRSKYAPVVEYLQGVRSDRVDLTYRQIEEMVGEPLPPSAHNHRAAWSNSDQNPWPLMRHVLDAGWRVESIRMGSKVVFVRAR
ncbi:MAG: hypothetical protein ISP10_02415 [Aeromicrobium sp.]|nr:hypothetical protein [Aeromicrobium sp.]